MKINSALNINKGEIISVVGAGGKTSFIAYIAKMYRDTYRVLSTTTTRIYKPNSSQYENIVMTSEEGKKYRSNTYETLKNGVVVMGKYINNDNKIIGLDFEEINKIEKEFDLILIEADGSKKKKLKGWKTYEPVIYPKTNKVIGIVDITSIDMEINEDNIHNLNEFKKIAYLDKSDIISINHLKNMIVNKNGLFRNSVGEKILFINKVENKKHEELAKKLINLIKIESNDIDTYYGSVIKEYYKAG